MPAAITSPAGYPRQRKAFSPTISLEIDGYIVECVPQPRMLVFREIATGMRTYRPLAPTLYTLAVLLFQRHSAGEPQTSRIFITLEEAVRTAYPDEQVVCLDRTTRRRIGRQINRLSEVIAPYFTLINLHRDHRCIGYQLSLTSDQSLFPQSEADEF